MLLDSQAELFCTTANGKTLPMALDAAGRDCSPVEVDGKEARVIWRGPASSRRAGKSLHSEEEHFGKEHGDATATRGGNSWELALVIPLVHAGQAGDRG